MKKKKRDYRVRVVCYGMDFWVNMQEIGRYLQKLGKEIEENGKKQASFGSDRPKKPVYSSRFIARLMK